MTAARGSLTGRFPVKRAVINESTAASNEIVAAVPDKRIVVVGWTVFVDSQVDLTWQSGATALSGPMQMPVGVSDHDADVGLFETAQGEALNLLSGGAVQVSGYLSYVEV